jgi:hypothetical protein
MSQTLPPEIEKMLLKPELSNQIARTLSNNLSPFIERYVKEAVSKTLVPAFQAQTTVMHQELAREMQNEIMGLKKDVISWQTEALRSQEVSTAMTLALWCNLTVQIDHDPRHGAVDKDTVRANQVLDAQHCHAPTKLELDRHDHSQFAWPGYVFLRTLADELPRCWHALDGKSARQFLYLIPTAAAATARSVASKHSQHACDSACCRRSATATSRAADAS